MRNLIWLGLLAVGALFVAGAIKIQQGANNQIEITVDKQKAEQTAEHALEEGREVLHEAEQAVEKNQAAAPQQGEYNR